MAEITFDRALKSITAFLTAILAGVGIWYAIETRNLRIAAEAEIEEYKKQFHYTIRTDVYPTVISPKLVTEYIMEDKIKQELGKIRYTKEELGKVLKYLIQIENIGDRSAYDVYCYIYNSDGKNYMKSPQYKIFVKAHESTNLSFIDEKQNYISHKELMKEAKEQYYLKLESIENLMKSRELNYIFLFYRDILDKNYLRIRGFKLDDYGNIIHGDSQFHELN